LIIEDSSYEEEEIVILEGDECGNNHDYRVILIFHYFIERQGMEEFIDWQIDVDRFFDVMNVPETKQVKMVAIRLKSSIVAVWWDKLVVQRQTQRKAPIQTWQKMKQLMLEWFLPEDY